MARLLRVGVLAASAAVLVGGVLFLLGRGGTPVSYRVFAPDAPRSAAGLRVGLAHLDPAALIQLGVLVLIATPVARVVFAAASFAGERDWFYLAVSLIVLSVLLFGFARVA